ncbi:MAG: hypothetical protein HC844_19265, partial [Tabrizicola sp.]|nr:hypothetical protein [Tabrizicola sp.]
VRTYRALIDSSPLKNHLIEGTDLIIVRELNGGIYYGTPRGIEGSGDDERGRPRHGAVVVREAGAELARGEILGAGMAAGVLDVDEHRGAVGRGDDAGDLLPPGAGEKAADLACRGVGGQHLVHAEIGQRTILLGADIAHVGLDPQPRVRVAPDAVRAGKGVVIAKRLALEGGRLLRRSGDDEKIPGKGRGRMICTVIAPADDLAKVVLGAGVRGIDLRQVAAVVVGQREIDLACVRIDSAPFRAVHLRRSGLVGGEAGVDEDVRQIGETVLRRQAVLSGDERQPFAAAVGIEFRHVKRARIQQIARCGGRIIGGGGDELVDVFKAAVVARIADHGLARDRGGEDHAFMGKAAKMGAFHRRRGGIERVDLDHPAEGVRLVPVILGSRGAGRGGVEADMLIRAASRLFPAIPRFLVRHAVAVLFAGHFGIGVDEIARPVLFGGHVGIPGRRPIGTIVERAAGARAVRAELGDKMRRAAGRAGDRHFGKPGDPAVHRIGNDGPASIGCPLDALDRDAMGVQLFQHLVIFPRAIRIEHHHVAVKRLTGPFRRMKDTGFDIFVVGDEKPVGGGAVDGEVVHAVVMHANLHALFRAGVAAGREGGHVAGDRRAPGGKDLHLVAFRHDDRVLLAQRHGSEAEKPRCAG